MLILQIAAGVFLGWWGVRMVTEAIQYDEAHVTAWSTPLIWAILGGIGYLIYLKW